MNRIEKNLRKSFAEVKKDIIEIKNQILIIAEGQEKIQAEIDELRNSLKRGRKR